jgi:hypothetical protein
MPRSIEDQPRGALGPVTDLQETIPAIVTSPHKRQPRAALDLIKDAMSPVDHGPFRPTFEQSMVEHLAN